MKHIEKLHFFTGAGNLKRGRRLLKKGEKRRKKEKTRRYE